MKLSLYPHLHVTHITKPNRLYAVPLIGIVVKLIMIIPIAIELFLLGMGVFVLSIGNSFSVLLDGKNMNLYVEMLTGVLKLITKVQMFVTGLSDRYPGFALENDDPHIKVDIAVHTKPNRWFAFPVLGGLARLLLLLPFIIYSQLIRAGAQLGVVVSFAPVLFMGKYPETTYELFRDYNRLQLATATFIGGLQDDYPRFDISKNHLTAKIVLIVIGVLLSMAGNAAGRNQDRADRYQNYQYPSQYQQYQNNQNTDYNNGYR